MLSKFDRRRSWHSGCYHRDACTSGRHATRHTAALCTLPAYFVPWSSLGAPPTGVSVYLSFRLVAYVCCCKE
jgi:hypothetical protein